MLDSLLDAQDFLKESLSGRINCFKVFTISFVRVYLFLCLEEENDRKRCGFRGDNETTCQTAENVHYALAIIAHEGPFWAEIRVAGCGFLLNFYILRDGPTGWSLGNSVKMLREQSAKP